jgi:multimeric flavodoxin WrbA
LNTESKQITPQNSQTQKLEIVGFIASPHKTGNTAWIVNKILEGAKQQGTQTQSYCFSELDIKPCRGCLCCHNNGDRGCVVKDDMQKLYAAIEDADAIVFGSPIYMGQMSGQAKIFTDRLFAAISTIRPTLQRKSSKEKTCPHL